MSEQTRAWPSDVAWLATVYPDWTTLQFPDGSAYAFSRSTGKVFKLPSDECPFVQFPSFVPHPPSPTKETP